MSQYWMFEAALRSLVMGAAIFATLKVLRVRQVRAQRIAWVLTLLAAVAMPALVRWPIAMRLPAPHLPTIVAPSPSRATLPDLTPIPMGTVSEHRPPHPARLDPPPRAETRAHARLVPLAACRTLCCTRLPDRHAAACSSPLDWPRADLATAAPCDSCRSAGALRHSYQRRHPHAGHHRFDDCAAHPQ